MWRVFACLHSNLHIYNLRSPCNLLKIKSNQVKRESKSFAFEISMLLCFMTHRRVEFFFLAYSCVEWKVNASLIAMILPFRHDRAIEQTNNKKKQKNWNWKIINFSILILKWQFVRTWHIDCIGILKKMNWKKNEKREEIGYSCSWCLSWYTLREKTKMKWSISRYN